MNYHYSLLLLAIFASCSNRCDNFQDKAEIIGHQYQVTFRNKSATFSKLGTLIDKLIDSSSKNHDGSKYIGYSVKPQKYSDSGLNIQDPNVSTLLTEINCNELIINFEIGPEAKPAVFLYPNNLDIYNPSKSCPYFSGELLYNPSLEEQKIQSNNFHIKKIGPKWYLRTSVSSL